jgi:hypothetical protein
VSFKSIVGRRASVVTTITDKLDHTNTITNQHERCDDVIGIGIFDHDSNHVDHLDRPKSTNVSIDLCIELKS